MDIQHLLNTTSAGQIAKQLDAKDGAQDGKIKASIWNEFVKDKGGKQIQNYISVENAMNSITTYAVRNAKTQENTSANKLAGGWLNSLKSLATNQPAAEDTPVNNPQAIQHEQQDIPSLQSKATSIEVTPIEVPTLQFTTPGAEPAPTVDKQPAPTGTEQTQTEVTSTGDNQFEFTYQGVKHYISKDSNGYYTLSNDNGLEKVYNADELKQLKHALGTYGINPENIIPVAQDEPSALTEAEQTQITNHIEKAKALLGDIATMDLTPEDITFKDGTTVRTITLPDPDNRWVEVTYNNDGEIDNIRISHDTAKIKRDDDGTESDYAEIEFNGTDLKIRDIDKKSIEYPQGVQQEIFDAVSQIFDKPTSAQDNQPATTVTEPNLTNPTDNQEPVQPQYDGELITNMTEVLQSQFPNATIEHDEFGIIVNGKDFGNTKAGFDRAVEYLKTGNLPEDMTLSEEIATEELPSEVTIQGMKFTKTDDNKYKFGDIEISAETMKYLEKSENFRENLIYYQIADHNMSLIENEYNFKRSSGVQDADYQEFCYNATQEVQNRYFLYRINTSDKDSKLNSYIQIMDNWQDNSLSSDTYSRGMTTWTNVQQVTLANGEHVYKTDQGYFYPHLDGNIGFDKIPDELINE